MNRLLKIAIVGVVAWLFPAVAFAGNQLGNRSVSEIFIVALMLLIAGICFFIAMKIFSSLRGGEMASAWQIIAISFVIMLIAEAVSLLNVLAVANIGQFVAMLIRLLGLAAVMMGMSRIRKVLS
jgi:hypothetical protein